MLNEVPNLLAAHAPGVVLSPYNSGWREHRRFVLMTLRNFGLGKQSMEHRILGETHRVMELLEQSNGKSSLNPQIAAHTQHQSPVWNLFFFLGESINPETIFHHASSNIIFQVLFAQRFNNEDDFMKFFTNFFQETSKIINGPWSLVSICLLWGFYMT